MSLHRTALVLMLILATGALAACTKPPARQVWQNPDVPQEQWSVDTGECRRLARREMEREAGLQPMRPADNLGGGLDVYRQNMNNYDLRRLQARVFERCMRANGYMPASENIRKK